MLEYIAPMKIALIALVILSVIVILGLIVFSFKLLRKTQKEEKTDTTKFIFQLMSQSPMTLI